MERLLMAPSISPSSMALAVPMAWEAEPMAMPLAMGSWILNSLQIASANMFPKIPVTRIAATVMGT